MKKSKGSLYQGASEVKKKVEKRLDEVGCFYYAVAYILISPSYQFKKNSDLDFG